MHKYAVGFLALVLTWAFAQTPSPAPAASSPYVDAKYCGFVPRTVSGEIKRSSTELKHFQIVHPCPSTGLRSGACPGWAIDHVISLACGGCDSITNMQWLPIRGKSCTSNYCKDRYERLINYPSGTEPGLNPTSCKPKLLGPEFFEPPIGE